MKKGRRGHDVVSVHDSPGRGTHDEEVFQFVAEVERAVVTENVSDFPPLAEAVLAARGNPGSLINALDELLRARRDQPVDSELWL